MEVLYFLDTPPLELTHAFLFSCQISIHCLAAPCSLFYSPFETKKKKREGFPSVIAMGGGKLIKWMKDSFNKKELKNGRCRVLWSLILFDSIWRTNTNNIAWFFLMEDLLRLSPWSKGLDSFSPLWNRLL